MISPVRFVFLGSFFSLFIFFPSVVFAQECRNASVASAIETITFNRGVSNQEIARRMREGHVYPTRLVLLRRLARMLGRRNPEDLLRFRVTCRVLRRTFSRSLRRVRYTYKCYARGSACHFRGGRVRPRGPVRP